MSKLVKKDKIWLKLKKQFSIRRDSKKLNWKNAKYIVKKIINSHLIKFDILSGLNNAFHVNKLRLVNDDLLLN